MWLAPPWKGGDDRDSSGACTERSERVVGMTVKNMQKDMDKIISLAKRRGFVFPGSEIYGGLANSWDYGPLGHLLKQNIKNAWWKCFVQERGDMVPLDTAIIMNPKVWETFEARG